ncbi:hypothetical protein [Ascidiimonas aurantiaca]|uniref:hypothetical protein n=1 Tax=Ascidiimonas aurantiaca TaxID=1685432 RepID=UPI0030EB76BE
MIVIISSQYDITTQIVIDWLYSLDTAFQLIYSEDVSNLETLGFSSDSYLTINGIPFTKNTIVWHRRGRVRLLSYDHMKKETTYRYLKKEENALVKALELVLSKNVKKYIGSFLAEDENYKLYHLMIAKQVGLHIPETEITTSKANLVAFKRKYGKIISKDLRYPVFIKLENTSCLNSAGTIEVLDEDIEQLADFFEPVYLQQLLPKAFEVRVFCIEEQVYAMAIFSQNNEKTQLDYRNYDPGLPNRCVPFKLPSVIEKKLKTFMNKAGLSTGSADFIVTKDNTYYFLEINPMGQLDWVSKNCNYHIEKNIAHMLYQNTIS